jgi:hypothetical protein
MATFENKFERDERLAKMPEATIQYFYTTVNVRCDGKCQKAWGINNRPKKQLSGDEDDYEFLADAELPVAPKDPGTYEGGSAKPLDVSLFPNKWCVRECERCQMWDVGEEPPMPQDFTKRKRNLNVVDVMKK